jgi:thermostable 8-oxoguanine DNA glycosylase
VHILRWLRSKGFKTPQQTPSSSKRYHELEQEFLRRADIMGRDPAELDLEIWNTYNKKTGVKI